jgi:ribosomal protein S14
MPLDADLLNAAKAAEARVIDAEQAADIARAEFHGAVRRLQLAGASLREIAQALGLSHQRVHQIIEAAGGSRRWRKRRVNAGDVQSCSFCGHDQAHVNALIPGPGVSICDRCISRVREVMTTTSRRVSTPFAVIQQVDQEDRAERCSFCGKRRHQVSAMASAGSTRICGECLELAHEIGHERLSQ